MPSFRRSPALAVVALTVPVLLGLAACGDDDGGGVRDASSSASGSISGSGSASSTDEKGCAPVGEDLEADATRTVEVSLSEYRFDPDSITVDAGIVTFATTNDGEENHELAFLPGGGEVPLTEDGAPDEDALAAAGAFELEGYSPGQSCSITVELAAGSYTLFCLVETEAGRTHASLGMLGELTVE